uniref:8.9 kDa family member n=1 Tax=Rhipicephalus appendiculatus TaxID=34631 RepID=A0A131YRD6_RHIAP
MKYSLLVISLVAYVAVVKCVFCPARFANGRCFIFGRVILDGLAWTFNNPCVQVSCNYHGRTITIKGCPGNEAPGAPQPMNRYPGCCHNCDIL